jgi:hypothetical protein
MYTIGLTNRLDEVKYSQIYEQLTHILQVRLFHTLLISCDGDIIENNHNSLFHDTNDIHYTRLPSIINRPMPLYSIHPPNHPPNHDASGSYWQQPNALQRRNRRSWSYYADKYCPQQSSMRLNSLVPVVNNLVIPIIDSNNILSANISVSTTLPQITNMSLEEFMQLDYIISNILTQDLTDADIGDSVMRGLNEIEIIYGLIDASYNSTIYRNFYSCCPIGLEDFVENEHIKQIVGCGHIYKLASIMRWFKKHTKCPLCRYELIRKTEERVIVSAVNIEREISAILNETD